jgi:hypothetical protein
LAHTSFLWMLRCGGSIYSCLLVSLLLSPFLLTHVYLTDSDDELWTRLINYFFPRSGSLLIWLNSFLVNFTKMVMVWFLASWRLKNTFQFLLWRTSLFFSHSWSYEITVIALKFFSFRILWEDMLYFSAGSPQSIGRGRRVLSVDLDKLFCLCWRAVNSQYLFTPPVIALCTSVSVIIMLTVC